MQAGGHKARLRMEHTRPPKRHRLADGSTTRAEQWARLRHKTAASLLARENGCAAARARAAELRTLALEAQDPATRELAAVELSYTAPAALCCGLAGAVSSAPDEWTANATTFAQLLGDTDGPVRHAAAQALCALGPATDQNAEAEVVSALGAAASAEGSDGDVRAAAFKALGKLLGGGEKTLCQPLPLRFAWLRSLAVEEAFSTLTRATAASLLDPLLHVRLAVLKALGRIGAVDPASTRTSTRCSLTHAALRVVKQLAVEPSADWRAVAAQALPSLLLPAPPVIGAPQEWQGAGVAGEAEQQGAEQASKQEVEVRQRECIHYLLALSTGYHYQRVPGDPMMQASEAVAGVGRQRHRHRGVQRMATAALVALGRAACAPWVTASAASLRSGAAAQALEAYSHSFNKFAFTGNGDGEGGGSILLRELTVALQHSRCNSTAAPQVEAAGAVAAAEEEGEEEEGGEGEEGEGDDVQVILLSLITDMLSPDDSDDDPDDDTANDCTEATADPMPQVQAAEHYSRKRARDGNSNVSAIPLQCSTMMIRLFQEVALCCGCIVWGMYGGN
eukprot:COSAG05_NODE_1353_length_5111_cov_5.861931_1_plen_564_part_00